MVLWIDLSRMVGVAGCSISNGIEGHMGVPVADFLTVYSKPELEWFNEEVARVLIGAATKLDGHVGHPLKDIGEDPPPKKRKSKDDGLDGNGVAKQSESTTVNMVGHTDDSWDNTTLSVLIKTVLK